MVALEFDVEYLYADDPTGGIVLSVVLQANARATRLLAFAHCLFQADYADLLDLTLTDGIPLRFSTAGGGAILAYGHQVTIEALGHAVNSTVYFTDHPGHKRNVLGRKGWLHHFKLGLIEYESKLYLGYQDRRD